MKNERGMALAITVFALVVVAALVAGTFYAATQEQRTADNSRRSVAAFGAAESAVDSVVTSWNPTTLNKKGIYPADSATYGTSAAPITTPGGTGTFYGTVYRLNTQMFLVDMTGRDNSNATAGQGLGIGGRSRLGVLVKIQPINFNVSASLTTKNGVSLQGNATADGTDSPPPAWACPPPGAALAGVSTSPGSSVTTGGNGTVAGNPPVQKDSNITAKFAGIDSIYAQLAQRANIVLSGGNYKTDASFTGANCNTSDQLNWGDGQNTTACSTYFPIIHITGDVTLNGNQGQGILLVDGNLSVQGSYQFFGITIVKGTMGSAGGGSTAAHFYGATMAQDVSLTTTNTFSGKATLLYSNCAIQTVMNNVAVTSLLKSRSWVQLY
jgi:type II secretory pathway pseudopilin PulG